MGSILGIGNALTDIVVTTSDKVISSRLGLEGGSVSHVDETRWKQLWSEINKLNPRFVAGGSAANTVTCLSRLGVNCIFFGKIGNDAIGAAYKADLLDNGVRPRLMTGSQDSGCSCVLLSRESRTSTVVTYKGAAAELSEADIDKSLFEGVRHLHLEGYLMPRPEVFEKALVLAKEAGCTVSLDLASSHLVSIKLEWLRNMAKRYVDLIFANEEEANAFSCKDAEKAAEDMVSCCSMAVVKLGQRGSLIHDGTSLHRIAQYPANCLDATGAGDTYAAGFIYGLERGFSVEACGTLASFMAAKAVEVHGARLDATRWQQIVERTNDFHRESKRA